MAVASESKASLKKKAIEETKKRRRVIENGANDDDGNKAKRAKCPGVRVVGNRIYDSENGKSCHQVFRSLQFQVFPSLSCLHDEKLSLI